MPRLYIDGKDKGEFENYLVNPGCKHEIIFFMANETEEYINLLNYKETNELPFAMSYEKV
jgi:hypothetical protein